MDTTAHQHIHTPSSSELLLNIFTNNLQQTGKFRINEDHYRRMMRQVKGTYADPNGIRPVGMGVRRSGEGKDYLFASESVIADSSGFTEWDDVKPAASPRQVVAAATFAPDIFEYVYFACADLVQDGISVYRSRMVMGDMLAEEVKRVLMKHNIEVDVIPVPDTSRVAALNLAQKVNLLYRERFIKNRSSAIAIRLCAVRHPKGLFKWQKKKVIVASCTPPIRRQAAQLARSSRRVGGVFLVSQQHRSRIPAFCTADCRVDDPWEGCKDEVTKGKSRTWVAFLEGHVYAVLVLSQPPRFFLQSLLPPPSEAQSLLVPPSYSITFFSPFGTLSNSPNTRISPAMKKAISNNYADAIIASSEKLGSQKWFLGQTMYQLVHLFGILPRSMHYYSHTYIACYCHPTWFAHKSQKELIS
ncbi:hypothetical protein BDP27DRAFT_1359963 [Rhodocollybia butyracea]|uniref:Uncharacterized protein n=1 Tax=Rhodocollybia butyracea TaxID=206335 RepID=A0A9P5UD02_9AGAR|nr:hypothetical protein BDP27DRAFT_1359963 [Rhodocollybia butyracea]